MADTTLGNHIGQLGQFSFKLLLLLFSGGHQRLDCFVSILLTAIFRFLFRASHQKALDWEGKKIIVLWRAHTLNSINGLKYRTCLP